jgi:4-hydroxy-tetrahydrodipicolinate synthase
MATLLKLAKLENICSIKEATADLQLLQNLVQQTNCAVLSGDDPTYLASLGCGGHGLVSVASNCFPEPFVQIFELVQQSNLAKAQELNRQLFPFIEAMGIETNPGPVKYVTSLQGMGSDRMRSPLVPCLADSKVSLDATFKRLQGMLSNS